MAARRTKSVSGGMWGVWGCGSRRVVAVAGQGVVWRGEVGEAEYRELAEAVGTAVREGRAGCAAAAPPGVTWTRFVECPVGSRRKADRIWEGLLDLELPFPVEGAAWGMEGVRRKGGGWEGIGTAIQREDWEASEAGWRAEGWEITHGDSAAGAIWEALGGGQGAGRRTIAWVEPGSVLTACGEGGILTGVHYLRSGPGETGFGTLWTRRAAGMLETGDGEKRDIWWCGPEAGRARREMESAARREGVRFAVAEDGEGVLAVALAERAAKGRGAGLKRGEKAHPGWVAKERRERRFWMGLTAGLAALVLALNGLAGRMRLSEERMAGERVGMAAESIAGRRLSKGQERLLVGRMLEEVAERMAVAGRSMGREGDTAERLREILSGLASTGAEARRVAVSGKEATVELTAGTAGRFGAEMGGRGWEGMEMESGEGAIWRGRKTP